MLSSEIISTETRRGRPHTNARVHELYADEANHLPAGNGSSTAAERRRLKKAAHVMLFQGFSITEIAKALTIPKSTVCLWRNKLTDEEKSQIEQVVLNSVSMKMADFVGAALESITKIALYCSDPEYLRSNSPLHVARLAEVLGNQAFRLVEAQQRAEIYRRQHAYEKSATALPHSEPPPDLVPAIE
jgi:hypothetical protein